MLMATWSQAAVLLRFPPFFAAGNNLGLATLATGGMAQIGDHNLKLSFKSSNIELTMQMMQMVFGCIWSVPKELGGMKMGHL